MTKFHYIDLTLIIVGRIKDCKKLTATPEFPTYSGIFGEQQSAAFHIHVLIVENF